MLHNRKRKTGLQLRHDDRLALLSGGSTLKGIQEVCQVVESVLGAQGVDVSLQQGAMDLRPQLDINTNYGKLLEYIDIKIGEEVKKWLIVNPFALIAHTAQLEPRFAKLLHDSLNGATASLVFYTDGFNGGDPLKANAHVKLMNAVLQQMINISTHSLLSINEYTYIHIYLYNLMFFCIV